MKTLKINGFEIKAHETLEDINIKRFIASKQYLLEREAGIQFPTLKGQYRAYEQGFDQDSKARMLLSIRNLLLGMGKIEVYEDADQMLFALMTVDEGEDETVSDSTFLKEKMDRYAAKGLSQRQVSEEVETFLLASKPR